MNKYTFLILMGLWAVGTPTASAQNWQTHFEDTWGTETVTYEQGIAFFQKMADNLPQIQLKTYGTTDIGLPLHLAIFSPSGEFDAQKLKAQGKSVLMINNAIHPGEPDGVDATLMLFRDYALDKNKAALLENTVLVTIPFYNVGGALNRGEYRRTNQNGPTSYGFRGNARNLDLNRDFIKADSRNVRAFMQIFQEWDPDVFVDNHVSNGADYQYVLTYLATQADKLGGDLGEYMRGHLIPDLKERMLAQDWDICPYVNVYGRSPIPDGYTQFYDAPRYSSGYAALFQSLGFINETHMLKPFDVRVKATYSFMETIIEHLQENGAKIRQMRAAERARLAKQKRFALHWLPRRD
ncbi:MAG: M14 family metallopeptidase, partial [Bacteroidota bacterium]